MKQIVFFIFFLLLFSCAPKVQIKMAPKIMVTDTYFGKQIVDPYRYMENLEDSLFINWIKEQNLIESNTINSLKKRRELLKKIENQDQLQSNLISKLKITNNDYYFYLKKEVNNVSKLYFRKTKEGEEVLLYDPKAFKPTLDKEYQINYIGPSYDASKVVIGLAESGIETSEMIILDVSSKEVYPQVIGSCWPAEFGGVEWLPDNSGFIYFHIPVLDKTSEEYLLNTASVLYKLGTNPKQLNVLFSKDNNPEFNIKEEDFCEITIKDQYGDYMFSYTSGASPYINYYYASIKEIENKRINWTPLFSKENLIGRFVVDKESIYFMTSKDASNFKICKTSLTSPNFKNPEVLVAEDSVATITDMTLTKDGLFFVKTKNGVEANVFFLNTKNQIEKILLPKPSGYVNISSKGYNFKDLRISTEGWTSKKERFKYNFTSEKFEEFNIYPQVKSFDGEDLIVEEIEVPSHDGVKVPLSIIYKKGTLKNGKNRLLINGYGSYGWSNSPYLYPYLFHWVKEGGIYAVAHVRGGGEKGNEWRMGGSKTSKSNTWKDFIACTEYLINNDYTSSSRTAAWSASAGAVCIGKAITERPELYAAAAIHVGFLNPLRLESTPNGKNSIKEFGTIKDSIEFSALYEMDAYHSIVNNTNYPAVYLTGGLNDNRVAAWQPSKFAARLQDATKAHNPILLSIDFEGGHGFNVSNAKENEKRASILSFLFWQTGHPEYQPEK